MNILLTSGGTKVPIDMVRHIANMSSGTFGSKLCAEFLHNNHMVTFLHAEGSKNPFKLEWEFDVTGEQLQEAHRKGILAQLIDSQYNKLDDKFRHFNFEIDRIANGLSYTPVKYKTFDDYSSILEKQCKTNEYDVIVLAAAVSDYGVSNYVGGKIRSKDNLNIQLEPFPKLINKVKEWSPKSKLVGFKLLVNSITDELLEAAKKSIVDNNCDLVVANDLRDIKNSNHTVYVVGQKGFSRYSSDSEDPNFIAKMVVKEIEWI